MMSLKVSLKRIKTGCITRFLRPARVTRGFQAPQEQIYSQEGQSRKKRVMLPVVVQGKCQGSAFSENVSNLMVGFTRDEVDGLAKAKLAFSRWVKPCCASTGLRGLTHLLRQFP